ncbi:MAG: glycoside hydrolase family 25 protein [Limisphaerales bacterium]
MKRSTLIQTSLGVVAAVALTFGATSVRANNTTRSLLGIDVSSFQGFITWSSVKGDGVAFAFARASEGTASNDSDFSGNVTRGKSAGLQMGCYHFAYPAEGCPSVQASHFWTQAGSKITTDGKSIMPMVDCEEFTGIGCSEGTYTTWYNDWSADLKTHTTLTLRPIIYVSACNACNLNSAITMGSWIADYNGGNLYTGNPWTTCCSCSAAWGSSSCNNNTWSYWQVSSTGSISGISGNVDLDAYNGTLSELISWQGV